MASLEELNQPEEIKKVILEYATKPFGFLLMAGMNGTGKSYAAEAIYNTVSPFKLPAYDHDIAYFTTQAALNMRWQESQAKYGTTLGLLKICQNCKLLVLDDIGTRIPSEAFMDFIYEIVDERYCTRMQKGTIITTNKNSNDLRKMLGDAFFSRATSGDVIRIDGKDRRMKEF